MKNLSLILVTVAMLSACSSQESPSKEEVTIPSETTLDSTPATSEIASKDPSPVIACAEKTVRDQVTASSININPDDAWEDLTAQSDGTWTVTGKVSADSTEGGQIESNFTCNKVSLGADNTQCNADCVYLDPLVKLK